MTSDGWINCSSVRDGLFQAGRAVSVNKDAKILKLTCKKLQIDGSVLEKIVILSNSGAEYNFLKNGQKIADIIARLNLCKDSQNWLSMQPNPLRYYSKTFTTNFGEHNEDNI